MTFENFIGRQIGEALETLEAVRRVLATRAAVSSRGKEITIVFDDHDSKDLVMNFLCGEDAITSTDQCHSEIVEGKQ